MDLWWAVVDLAVVGGAFDAVAVSAVSLDYPGTGSVPSWGVGSFGDFVDGFSECGDKFSRGEDPPGWGPGGGSRGSCV